MVRRCLQCGCCPPPLVLHGTADWQRKGRSWVLAVCTVSYVLFTSVVAGSTTRFSPSTVVDVCGGGGVAIANNSGNRSSTKNNNWMLKCLQSSFFPTTKSRNGIGLCPTNKTWEFCEEMQHKQKTNSDLRHNDNCRSQGYISVTDS